MPAIKAATVADVSAIARVEVDTWRATYAGVLPDRYLVGMSVRLRAASWLRFVTRRPGDLVVAKNEDGEVVGFGSCGPQREPDLRFAGEVFTLYVSPDLQGEGIGRHLLTAMFSRLVRCGLYSGLLWVLAQNPSRFFYERMGGQTVAHHGIRFAGTDLDAIAFGWPDLASTIMQCGSRGRISKD